ncbi:MAG: hypothetical protein DWQ47_10135 [Acidobacteria bacterium]|nr:MAG: hypothetical protein DWQ32_12550 [Acidobacteriota bacterium]REJ97950.1 MAG: hypothetical protein DWQ38_15350 [Acidobacteriota bacterium]REK16693.1 MAG: hypothetical protein DWQ43_00395 [Acidobacteriota bacterium]REK42604.1 MAG: hypothetical protein DWQ47_10135 [Acidobacteriota bacterium]
MIKQRMIAAFAVVAALVLGAQDAAHAGGKKKEARFTVRIENISSGTGLPTVGDATYPFALSPGMYVVTNKKMSFFKVGKKASSGLEAQAEDGNPETLSKSLLTKVGSLYMGVFNTPEGAEAPGPLLPGGSYEFSFTASEGMKLNLIAMFGQSNDLFYSPASAIELFKGGEPVSADITDLLMLWDAGTEVNQAPGVGDQQAPRQAGPNIGMAENGKVSTVMDSFVYPKTREVLKVTISAG